MLRLRVAVVLLVVAASLPAAWAGTAEAPELTDPADDQAVDGPFTQLPGLPVLTDDDFADIDLTAAWFDTPRVIDCVGDHELDCPILTISVATSAGWTSGTLMGSFTVERGPTSYATSTASGQTVSFNVSGTQVTGVENARASVGPDGLTLVMGLGRVGAVGGDRLTNLTLATTRTDPGLVTDPSFTQDDTTATDQAGPGAAFTIPRPEPAARIDVGIARTGDRDGNALTVTQRTTVPVQLRILNLGTDDDAYSIQVSAEPPLKDPPVFAAVLTPLPRGDVATPIVPISLAGMESGLVRVTFTVTTQAGASDDAFANIVLDLPATATPRDVVPSGLQFLTPAAEALHLDDAFDEFAEAVLLALLVLLAILAVFLAVALAPGTLHGTAAPESPPVAGPEEAPPAVQPAIVPAAAPPAAATVGGALAIESVTHDPEIPEEGQDVSTEILLRNPGPTRQVRVILSRDEADLDSKAATLPARSSKTIRLSWTAGPGQNNVRVRVMPA